MDKRKTICWLKRGVAYLLGFFLIAIGINISIKSKLGVSAVTSIPYVLSQKWTALSVGTWTTIIYCGYVLIQLALLGKNFKWYYIFQFAVATLFGWMVDLAALLVGVCVPDVSLYVLRIVYVLISTVFIAFGILIYLEANIMSMPAEGVNVAMSKRFKLPVSTCKIIFDVFIVSVAIVLSLIFFKGLVGVREGTVIIAVLVGFVMKPISKFCKKSIRTLLYGKEKTADKREIIEKQVVEEQEQEK